MRSTVRLVGLIGLVGLTLLILPACGDDSSPTEPQNIPDSASAAPPDAQNTPDSGATTDEAGEDDDAAIPAPQVSFRIAHLSPDAPPFDVCLAPHGTTDFQGPFVNAFAAATAAANGTPFPDDSGAATGLTYGQVSAYFTVDQGTYDVRLVAAGATACDGPLGASPVNGLDAGGDAGGDASTDASADAAVVDAVALDDGSLDGGSIDEAASPDDGGAAVDATVAVLDADIADASASAPDAAAEAGVALTTIASVSLADSFTTLLVAGEVTPTGADPSLTVAPIGDDSVLVSGGATLRAVNALASGVSQDFGFGAFDAGYLPVFTNVGFAQAASQVSPDEATLDGNGYLTVGEQDAVSFSARASMGAAADTVATQSLQIDLGAITTVIAIGGDTAGNEPAQLLFCVDNQPSGGALSDCSVLP